MSALWGFCIGQLVVDTWWPETRSGVVQSIQRRPSRLVVKWHTDVPDAEWKYDRQHAIRFLQDRKQYTRNLAEGKRYKGV